MNPWVIAAVVGVGALVLFGSSGTASAASGGGNYWPPTAADQAAVTQQIQGYAQNAEYGPNLPAADGSLGSMMGNIDVGNMNAEIAMLVEQSVGTYAAQTAQPTAAGWRQWVLVKYAQGLAQSGYAPGYPAPSSSNTSGNSYGGNPYAATTSGPMWGFPHTRGEDPILSGHGLGW